KVSDSMPLGKNSLRILEAKVLSIQDNTNQRYTKGFSSYLEVIPPGTELQFSIKLDLIILNDFQKNNSNKSLPFSTINEVFDLCKEFAQFVAQKELEYFQGSDALTEKIKKFYTDKKDTFNFRLGWGSGLLGTTVDGLLPQPLFKNLRDTFWVQRNHPTVPKSRRVTMINNQPNLPFGWVEVSL
ncbi:MAG: type III-A CRISPR-associated RAMP protein Csm5, partial [bacterium]|nr:type III-A CRISPR-associated RAMP protein Csm5 [bacterium]